jgi:hypothetical protein
LRGKITSAGQQCKRYDCSRLTRLTHRQHLLEVDGRSCCCHLGVFRCLGCQSHLTQGHPQPADLRCVRRCSADVAAAVQGGTQNELFALPRASNSSTHSQRSLQTSVALAHTDKTRPPAGDSLSSPHHSHQYFLCTREQTAANRVKAISPTICPLFCDIRLISQAIVSLACYPGNRLAIT